MRHALVIGLLSLVVVLVSPCLGRSEATPGPESAHPRYALSLYGGALTDEDWRKSIGGQADFVESQLVVAAVQRSLWGKASDPWSIGMEANAAKHFGIQEHWEFNVPVLTLSWHRFPWNETLRQSVGLGAGPSVTTQRPKAEEEINPSSRHLLLYWHLETTLALPQSPWSVLFRLHHRSTAYGVFGDEGGSNALTTGIRYHF